MKVGILAATGKSIGLGHLTRCLSIAISLRQLSHNIEFILENEYFSNWIHESGFSIRYSNQLMHKYDLIIVDKYDIDKKFLQTAKTWCNLLARVDDAYSLFDDKITDIIINCNPYAKEDLYEGIVRQDSHLILGAEYVPMDSKFCRLRNEYRLKNTIENITLTFGGSQNIDFVKRVCERIQTKNYYTNIFVLNGTKLKDSLRNTAALNLKLLPLISNIEEVLSVSDLVVCAASTTCWQLCASGIPFICFKTADNQKHNYDYIKNSKVGIALENTAIHDGT
ncbi:MAG TPA: glycosyltransferase, partial [Candidatus Nitrosocosmicus sp.]|nr:glycosyltransferase [Candidatus Nitrosocosmicus sp.]